METTKTDVKEAGTMVIRNKRITTPGRSAVLQIAVMLMLTLPLRWERQNGPQRFRPHTPLL